MTMLLSVLVLGIVFVLFGAMAVAPLLQDHEANQPKEDDDERRLGQ